MKPTDNLLPIADACRVAGMSARHLHRQKEEGRVRVVKIGRKHLFYRSEMERLRKERGR